MTEAFAELRQRKPLRCTEGFTDMEHGWKFFQIRVYRRGCSGTKNQWKSVRTPEGFLDAYAAENSSGTRGVGRAVAELN